MTKGQSLSGESRNIIDRVEHDGVKSFGSSDDSRPQSWHNTSETTSNSDELEIAIHSLLVDWKQRRAGQRNASGSVQRQVHLR